MRNNAMKTCALGAMLFGGTLGVTSAADAGLTWTSVGSLSYVNIRDTSYATEDPYGSSGTYTGSSLTTSWAGTSVTIGGTSSNGLSISAIKPDQFWVDIHVDLSFSVSASTTVSISGIGFANGSWFYLQGSDPLSSYIWSSVGAPGSGSEVSGPYASGQIVLQAGTYHLGGGTSINEGQTFGSSQTIFSLTVVPAPGAVALVAVAGSVANRRRKA